MHDAIIVPRLHYYAVLVLMCCVQRNKNFPSSARALADEGEIERETRSGLRQSLKTERLEQLTQIGAIALDDGGVEGI